ncbi:SDR family NAD(P)-dependent oxidoreductase [Pedobacter sp. NJ-S-72]
MKIQTAIVTGASTGIGKAIAGLFLQKAYNVVINSANETNLKSTFNELGNHERLAMITGDISKPATGQLLVDTALTRFGTVNVLVNNAGIFEPKPFFFGC